MTKIKLCGLSRPCDMETANKLKPDYVGFVFWKKSKRCISPETAESLKSLLIPGIKAVGVFLDETPEQVAALLNRGIVDLAQLHGAEDEAYLRTLRSLTDRPLIQAFRVRSEEDLRRAEESAAEEILLDAGAGTGTSFDWSLLRNMKRRYFLAGGLDPENVAAAVRMLHPYGVDVSSGIETENRKDAKKMADFVAAARMEDSP